MSDYDTRQFIQTNATSWTQNLLHPRRSPPNLSSRRARRTRRAPGLQLKQIPAPSLRPGDILVMDKLSAHKSPVAEAEVASRQAEIKYLPAYSPDLNPIEKMWRKLKQLLRGMKARTNEDLFLAVQTALEQVSKNDAGGWFQSCGCALYKN
jgi:hypothetical protein